MRKLVLFGLAVTLSCSAQNFSNKAKTNRGADQGSVEPSLAPVLRAVDPARFLAASSEVAPAMIPIQPPAPSQKRRVSFDNERKTTRAWWALAVAQHGSAFFDAWSTRQSLAGGRGQEQDPLLKPFANSAAIYPAIQILPFGMDYLSRRFMRSHNGKLRRLWWIPQTASTAGFVWCGAHNLNLNVSRDSRNQQR